MNQEDCMKRGIGNSQFQGTGETKESHRIPQDSQSPHRIQPCKSWMQARCVTTVIPFEFSAI